MRRRLALTLLVAAGAAGCDATHGAHDTTSEDLDRASAIWRDPWIAPQAALAPGPAYGTDGLVTRVAGYRTLIWRVPPRKAVATELALARQAGWQPTSSSCDGSVRVALVGPDEAVATLTAAEIPAGASVEVTGLVRHHLDDDWSAPEPVDRTCLDGRPDDFVDVDYQSTPLSTDEPDESDAATWQVLEQSSDAAALRERVDEDLRSRDLATLSDPELNEGRTVRSVVNDEIYADTTDLAGVRRLLRGWRLTWAACGEAMPTQATFAKVFPQGAAVIRAALRNDGTDLRATLPMTEGPTPPDVGSLPALPDDTCLAPGTPTIVGTPAVLPTNLTPVRH